MRLTGSRGHDEGMLHSRIIENNIAAAKKANTILRFFILVYDAWDERNGAIANSPRPEWPVLG